MMRKLISIVLLAAAAFLLAVFKLRKKAEDGKNRSCNELRSESGNSGEETAVLRKTAGEVPFDAAEIIRSIPEKPRIKEVFPGEQFRIDLSGYPGIDADRELSYSSEDESVVAVSADGTAVAGEEGTTNIRVDSPNGQTVTIPVRVSQIYHMFSIDWSAELLSNDHVGNNWDISFIVDGENFRSGSTVILDKKSSLRFVFHAAEDDTFPDVGEFSVEIPVSGNLSKDGYSMTKDVEITEDKGRYAGNTAVWRVNVAITPVW